MAQASNDIKKSLTFQRELFNSFNYQIITGDPRVTLLKIPRLMMSLRNSYANAAIVILADFIIIVHDNDCGDDT